MSACESHAKSQTIMGDDPMTVSVSSVVTGNRYLRLRSLEPQHHKKEIKMLSTVIMVYIIMVSARTTIQNNM